MIIACCKAIWTKFGIFPEEPLIYEQIGGSFHYLKETLIKRK